MAKTKLQKEVASYVRKHIQHFHNKRLQSLDKLILKTVLKRKNPYLYKAIFVLTAADIVKGIVDAHISSSEEGIFGDWLEGLAIHINKTVFNGRKSGIASIDLEFDKDGVRYIVNIKSGPNWANSSQIAKMKSDFMVARKSLRTSNSGLQVTAVNGCCYGTDPKPDKGDYFKYCGQKFWGFISGDENMFTDIIEPLGTSAKQKNNAFLQAYSRQMNIFTKQFTDEYCATNGSIDWEKLVRFNSGSRAASKQKRLTPRFK